MLGLEYLYEKFCTEHQTRAFRLSGHGVFGLILDYLLVFTYDTTETFPIISNTLGWYSCFVLEVCWHEGGFRPDDGEEVLPRCDVGPRRRPAACRNGRRYATGNADQGRGKR